MHRVSRERILPPVATLLRWRDEGLTQQQMADRVNSTDPRVVAGEVRPVTRSAVSVALTRADEADQRARYTDEVPWSPIRPEHQKDPLLTMLRTWARINRGDTTIPDTNRARFDSFRRRLERDQQVVDYDPGIGFHLVPRESDIDTGLIRVPQH